VKASLGKDHGLSYPHLWVFGTELATLIFENKTEVSKNI
jgi:hypothetical protein